MRHENGLGHRVWLLVRVLLGLTILVVCVLKMVVLPILIQQKRERPVDPDIEAEIGSPSAGKPQERAAGGQ
ncbi:MAG: hypothetical protein HY720_14005 [Planctomycetes bacterium]|nr:hypothetical protein [Planctomycetota bacterium]